jgi:hypothetical protein
MINKLYQNRFIRILSYGLEDCPYTTAYILDFKIFSIRFHRWTKSDDLRHYHDHPYNFYSILLKGSIVDRSAKGDEIRKKWRWWYCKAEHQHKVVVRESPSWTFVVTGPRKRDWGYWVKGKFRKRNHYFLKYGHHDPCYDERFDK